MLLWALKEGLTGAEALADYRRWNWRVRLVGTETWQTLQPLAQKLRAETADHSGPTVWFTVTVETESSWNQLFASLQGRVVHNRQEAIRLMYGEDIPLAELFIAQGKPYLTTSILPPLLAGDLHCYWCQHLGYTWDEQTLRTILYDFAYLRNTAGKDKTGRAKEALKYRHDSAEYKNIKAEAATRRLLNGQIGKERRSKYRRSKKND